MALQTTIGDLLGMNSGGLKAPGKQNAAKPPAVVEKTFNRAMDYPKRLGRGREAIKLTPELAQFYLQFNRDNCAINESRVAQYADQMMRGEWADTGDTIRFSKSAKLIDGQHRCLAVIRSGITIPVDVSFGLDDEVQAKIDGGRTRRARDIISMQGLATFESGIAGTAAHALINHSKGLPISSNVKRINHEIEAFYLEFPAFQTSIRFISDLPRRHVPLHHSKALVLHYLFAQKDVDLADQFMQKLFTGDSISRSNPIYHLREKLNESQRANAKPYTAREQYHACIRAWNYLRARKSLSSSRTLFPRSDEPLPEIE